MKRIISTVTPALLVAFFLIGCDQNDFEDPFDIPEDGATGFVQFDDIDTVAVSTGDTLEVLVELPTAIEEDVTVNFETSGSAVPGTDFTIPDVTVVDTMQTLRDTLANGEVRVTYDIRRYGVEYDASGQSGTLTIGYNANATNVDDATVTIAGLGNAALGEDRLLTLTLTSASSASGQQISAGRSNGFASTKTIVVTPLPDDEDGGEEDG